MTGLCVIRVNLESTGTREGPAPRGRSWTSRGGALRGWAGPDGTGRGGALPNTYRTSRGRGSASRAWPRWGRQGRSPGGGCWKAGRSSAGRGWRSWDSQGRAPGGGAGRIGTGRGGVLRGGAGPGPAVLSRAGSGRQPGRGRKPEAAAVPAREKWRALKVYPWSPSSLVLRWGVASVPG